MAVMLAGSVEITGVKELQKKYGAKSVEKVVVRTLNKTAAQAKTAVSKEVRKVYNVKAKRFNKAFAVKRARAGNAITVLTAKGPTPGLQNFGASKVRKGVTVRVRKDNGRKKVKDGFLADYPKGNPLVWKRTGEPKVFATKGRYAGKKREPIKRLYGPDPMAMIKAVGNDVIDKIINEKMEKIFNQEVRFELT